MTVSTFSGSDLTVATNNKIIKNAVNITITDRQIHQSRFSLELMIFDEDDDDILDIHHPFDLYLLFSNEFGQKRYKKITGIHNIERTTGYSIDSVFLSQYVTFDGSVSAMKPYDAEIEELFTVIHGKVKKAKNIEYAAPNKPSACLLEKRFTL